MSYNDEWYDRDNSYHDVDEYNSMCSDCMSPITSIITTRHRSTRLERTKCGSCAMSYTGTTNKDLYDYLQEVLDR